MYRYCKTCFCRLGHIIICMYVCMDNEYDLISTLIPLIAVLLMIILPQVVQPLVLTITVGALTMSLSATTLDLF